MGVPFLGFRVAYRPNLSLLQSLERESRPVGNDPMKELRSFLSFKGNLKNKFRFEMIDPEEMKKLIKRMKGKKACGLDWICGFSLKAAASLLNTELAFLINLSLKTGKFASSWKIAKVLPGFKNKGSKFDAKFYRPLSIFQKCQNW